MEMKKKAKYEELEIEIIYFSEDIIVASQFGAQEANEYGDGNGLDE